MKRYLIVGPSGSGKTSVGQELKRRGFRVIDTGREWAYLGDRKTGQPHPARPLPSYSPELFEQNAWLWDRRLVESSLQSSEHIIFCCGGADNEAEFFDLFDKVFVLNVDWDTLKSRLSARTNHHTSTELGLRNIYDTFYDDGGINIYQDLIHINSCGHHVQVTTDLIISYVCEKGQDKIKRSINAISYRFRSWGRSIFP